MADWGGTEQVRVAQGKLGWHGKVWGGTGQAGVVQGSLGWHRAGWGGTGQAGIAQGRLGMSAKKQTKKNGMVSPL